MKATNFLTATLVFLILTGLFQAGFGYPPAVGLLGNAKSCMSCHINNGPWTDKGETIIDVLDKETMKSLRQADGTFLIKVERGKQKTVLTVIGRTKEDIEPSPYRNAWIYVDPTRIGTNSLSKFAPGWGVNLQMACRVVGDNLSGLDGSQITVLPMTVQPLDDAMDTELQLQVMLTKGESVKGDAKSGMIGNYFERKVFLKVYD